MNYRARLIETDERWAALVLDLKGYNFRGTDRAEALNSIRGAITDGSGVEAEKSGVRSTKTIEIAV